MSVTPAQVKAFKAAAVGHRRSLAEIRDAAGLSLCDAADILALGVKQGRIAIHDEDRAATWIEVHPRKTQGDGND